MATTTAAASRSEEGVRKVGVLRATATGAIVAPLFFLLCWVGTFLPIGPATHMYLRLFTDAQISSSTALAQGICWSLAFGGITGFLLSIVYNALAPLDR